MSDGDDSNYIPPDEESSHDDLDEDSVEHMDEIARHFDPKWKEVDNCFIPTDRLLDDMKVTDLKSVLNEASIAFDIDSIVISSSFLHPLLNCLSEKALFSINTSVDRLKSTLSSRLTVTFDEQFHFQSNSRLKSLNLGSFPNIEVATVSMGSKKLHLHMFWLNPSYIPKISFFQAKYSLVITAAFNMARLTCITQNNFTDNPFNLNQDFFSLKVDTDILSFGRELLPFYIASKNRKTKQKKYKKLVVVTFFSLFQASLCQLSLKKMNTYTIEQLLPHDLNHSEFLKNSDVPKEQFLFNLAKDLCNSLTFVLSCAGYKNTTRTTFVNGGEYADDDPENVFNEYRKIATKVLSGNIMKEIFHQNLQFSENVHVYYDIGLEVRPLRNDISFLPHLKDTSKLIKKITKEHNDFPERRIPHREVMQMTHAQIFGVNGEEDGQNLDEDDADKMKNLDYLRWGPNYNTSCYSNFFLTEFGNWHTGNSRTQRKKQDLTVEEISPDEEPVFIYLQHLEKGGLCGAQMYSPQSRKVQLKETREATEYMDALASISMFILNNKKVTVSNKFDNIAFMIKEHLKELKISSSWLMDDQTSLRIECLMKMNLSPKAVKEYIKFLDGFLKLMLGTCQAAYLAEYYLKTVIEACDSLISIFPTGTKGSLQYKSLSGMSAAAKTACIYFSELLALEFGTKNLKGSIMKMLKTMFIDQGSYYIKENSRLRLQLNSTENPICHLKYGLSPSLLSILPDRNIDLKPGLVMTNCKMKMPLCATATPYVSVCESNKIHISYLQHRQHMLYVVHQFLSSESTSES